VVGGAPSNGDTTNEDDEQEQVYAWVTNFTTILNTEILQLNIHTPFIHNFLVSRLKLEPYDDARETTEKILENVASEAMNETMSKLNIYQRQIILKDVLKKGHTLIFVDTWMKERVGTLYGDVEITLLIWFTTGPPLSANATLQQITLCSKDTCVVQISKIWARSKVQTWFSLVNQCLRPHLVVTFRHKIH
jgi:hypothetical protein